MGRIKTEETKRKDRERMEAYRAAGLTKVAQDKYERETAARVSLHFNKRKDADILAALDTGRPLSVQIRELLREAVALRKVMGKEPEATGITILARRSAFHADPDTGNDAAYAELEINDAGKKVYLYLEWTAEADESWFCAAPGSIFDISEKLAAGAEDPDALMAERDRLSSIIPADKAAAYWKGYASRLKNAVTRKMRANGIDGKA